MNVTHQGAVREALSNYKRPLLSRPEIVAVSVGRPSADVTASDEPVLKIFVARGYAQLLQLPGYTLAPYVLSLGRKVRAEVEEMDPLKSPPSTLPDYTLPMVPYPGMSVSELRQKVRPAVGGDSVAHYNFGAGTITTIVRDSNYKGITYVLSCNHVLARLNSASYGDPILQPAAGNGGSYPLDLIAWLSRFIPLSALAGTENTVDCAVAYALPGNVLPGEVAWLGAVNGVRSIDSIGLGESVRKVGSSSGLNDGNVVGIHAAVKITYALPGLAAMTCVFDDQILTTPMSAYGDSGALLLDSGVNALGMLFAGSTTHTCFNYIPKVQSALQVTVSDNVVDTPG
jgi:hypothetical protein